MKNRTVRDAIGSLRVHEQEARQEADNLFKETGDEESWGCGDGSAWEASGRADGLVMAIQLFTTLLTLEGLEGDET